MLKCQTIGPKFRIRKKSKLIPFFSQLSKNLKNGAKKVKITSEKLSSADKY